MKKTLSYCLIVVHMLLILSVGALSAGIQKQPTQKLIPINIPKSFPAVKADPSFTTVTFWHAMNGRNEWWVNNLITWFNSTVGMEKKITVKGVFKGEYDAVWEKEVLAILRKPNEMPDLVQLNSVGVFAAFFPMMKRYDEQGEQPVKFMVLDDLLTAYKQMWMKEKLNPNAAAACSYKGKLLGLPFGSEMMGLYYNADAFKAAGLDPENPPKTMAEYAAAAGKLLVKDKTGNVKRYGSAGRLDVRLLSTWIPRVKNGSGCLFDMEDGRQGRATMFLAEKQDTLKTVLIGWKKLLDTGANDNSIYTNYEFRQQFENGMTAMYLASTVNMEGTLARFAAEKDKSKKFDARLARLPKLTAEDASGQTIGGYGLYLIDNGDEARKKGAFEFIKFLASVDASAYLTANSGYFPTNTDAMNTKYVQDALKKNPHRKLSFDLLSKVAANTKAQEPFIPSAAVFNRVVGDSAAQMEKKLTVGQAENAIAKRTAGLVKFFDPGCK